MRFRFRFRLRTALIVLTVFAVALGIHHRKVDRRREAARIISKNGGAVFYTFQVGDDREIDAAKTPPWPGWFVNLLGSEFFGDIVAIEVDRQHMPAADAKRLAELVDVDSLILTSFAVQDIQTLRTN
jgi:hypothetical protein